MAKSKHAPALYEVIGRGSQQEGSRPAMAVPKWFKRSQMAAQAASETSTEDGQEQAITEKSTAESMPSAAPEIHPGGTDSYSCPQHAGADEAGPEERIPVVKQFGGRLWISLNPLQGIVAAGGVLLLLCACFFIGQIRGAQRQSQVQTAGAGTEQLKKLIGQQQNPAVMGKDKGPTPALGHRAAARDKDKQMAASTAPAGSRMPESAPAAGGAGGSNTGEGSVNAVVVESFKLEHRKSAEYVQQWLREYGCETKLEKSGNRWRLITIKGFNLEIEGMKQKAEDFLSQVKSAGDECAKELHRKGLPVYRLNSPQLVKFAK